jgi:phosphate:Na+ symporter
MIMDPFSIALVNTIVRLAILIVLAPFVDVLEAIAKFLIREKPDRSSPALRLEERFLAHPALAVEQSRQVIGEMAKKSVTAIHTATALLTGYTEAGFKKVSELEQEGDRYEDALGSYIVKLTGREMTDEQNKTVSLYLHTLSDFERITDHALNIAQSAQEMHSKKAHFSEDASKELTVICAAVSETLRVTVEAFTTENLALAERVEPLEQVVDDLADALKLRHVARLQSGKCNIEQGFTFHDLLTDLERTSDHCSNVAVAMIELRIGSFDTHEYLDTELQKKSKNYERYYQAYKTKYALD